MPPTNKNQSATRKRIRKRKKRVASSSSSSSSSESDSDSSSKQVPLSIPRKQTAHVQPEPESEDSSSDSSSDSEPRRLNSPQPPAAVAQSSQPKERSPSPSPHPPVTMPSVLPSGDNAPLQEQALRTRFHKFWMASVADAFRSDLEEIRKESSMTTSRLAMLIDSLASGEDVFAPSSHPNLGEDVDEMAIVVDSSVRENL